MTQIWIQKAFRPVRALTPRWMSDFIRSAATAIFTPVLFSIQSGHWRSSFAKLSVSSSGEPVPWYTYPCIEFLRHRNYANKAILEFGAGQSTLWWAQRASRVVSLEANKLWLQRLGRKVPSNVDLHLIPGNEDAPFDCLNAVNQILDESPISQFDVVIIDGVCRWHMIEIASRVVKQDGIIICDNSEGYGFYEGFKNREFRRVDFFGNCPGVVLPHCTSIFFHCNSFVFDPSFPIPAIAKRS